MAQQPKSAAAAIYPNLKTGTPEIVQHEQPRLAAALFPALAPQQPKPLTQHEARELWVDHLMELSGIRRKR